MLFSSPFFIFFFLPVFLLLFFLIKNKYKNYFLLLGSISFYLWGEPYFCVIAILSALFDHYLCKKIYKTHAKKYVAIGVIVNISLLFYYKYANFLLNTVNQMGQFHFQLLNIILPIGISFIVFEKITYLVDVYRGIGKPAKNILHYLNYVFLFPKLLAGPIIKYHEIEAQLTERIFSSDDFFEGFKRFIRGLIKKVFFADTCSELVNPIFALQAGQLGCGVAWIGIIGFTLQIYFDFSGYSDMALGIARMLGFRLRENFNKPYIATSFTDFWRRWHISLSTWIKEYLYIPLGGSRVSQPRMYFNLWICFLLSGLWHGANWTFVLWGAYNGLFLVLDRLFWLKISAYLPQWVATAVTLFFVMLGWVIFRVSDFHQLVYYFSALFHPLSSTQSYIDITLDIKVALLLGTFLSIVASFPGFNKINQAYLAWNYRTQIEGFFYGIIGFLMICKVVGVSYNPFLYFRF